MRSLEVYSHTLCGTAGKVFEIYNNFYCVLSVLVMAETECLFVAAEQNTLK